MGSMEIREGDTHSAFVCRLLCAAVTTNSLPLQLQGSLLPTQQNASALGRIAQSELSFVWVAAWVLQRYTLTLPAMHPTPSRVDAGVALSTNAGVLPKRPLGLGH